MLNLFLLGFFIWTFIMAFRFMAGFGVTIKNWRIFLGRRLIDPSGKGRSFWGFNQLLIPGQIADIESDIDNSDTFHLF